MAAAVREVAGAAARAAAARAEERAAERAGAARAEEWAAARAAAARAVERAAGSVAVATEEAARVVAVRGRERSTRADEAFPSCARAGCG